MRDILKRLLRHRLAVFGACLIGTFALLAVLAPYISPYHPTRDFSLANKLAPPSSAHWLGTDELGRDMLTRILHGAQTSLMMGVVAVSIGLFIGAPIGAISGYYGGSLDMTVQRFVEILMAFPGILLAIVVVAVLGPGMWNAMIAVGIAFVPTYVRVVRGSVLEMREREFVEAARALGAGHGAIIRRHILPNCLAPIIVICTLEMGSAILWAAGLGFLGLGAQPPTPEWGTMLGRSRVYIRAAPHVTTFPGVAIMLAVLGFNLFGDGLRDALDPRLRGRM